MNSLTKLSFDHSGDHSGSVILDIAVKADYLELQTLLSDNISIFSVNLIFAHTANTQISLKIVLSRDFAFPSKKLSKIQYLYSEYNPESHA